MQLQYWAPPSTLFENHKALSHGLPIDRVSPCSPSVAAAAESARIRQASWECLACIASGYYDKLPAYMTEIFTLTQRTVQVSARAHTALLLHHHSRACKALVQC